MDPECTASAAAKIMHEYDIDHSGGLDLNEFAQMWGALQKGQKGQKGQKHGPGGGGAGANVGTGSNRVPNGGSETLNSKAIHSHDQTIMAAIRRQRAIEVSIT